MSARYPGHNPNPFSGSELGGMDLPADEIAADGRLARKLEATADRGTVRPSRDFADRVMAVIATEPTPAPVVAAGSAIRRLSLFGLVGSVRDAGRVTFGHGFPVVARIQALSLVLATTVAIGAGGVGAAAALGVFDAQNSPAPTTMPTQLVTPSPTESPQPSPSPEPSDSTGPVDSSVGPDATGTPEPSESPDPSESSEPTDPPQQTQGHSGGDSGSGGSGGDHFTSTPRPTEAPHPTRTPGPTEDGGGEHASTQPPSETPTPTPTAEHH
jgi:hypothetical protein